MNKRLPPLTTMMLDALVGTLPRLPQNTRAAAVCRCIFKVYSMTHGAKAPWEITEETAETCEKRVKTQPVIIVDTTAEVTEVDQERMEISGIRMTRGRTKKM